MGNGGVGDLWRAVKIAKNINLEVIPPGLTLGGGGGVPIAAHDVPNAFPYSQCINFCQRVQWKEQNFSTKS